MAKRSGSDPTNAAARSACVGCGMHNPMPTTAREAGIQDVDHANAAYGAYVPAGTPPEVVQKLEAALIAAVRNPQVKETLNRAGLEATGLPGKDLRRMLDEERRFWRPIVEASGFRSED